MLLTLWFPSCRSHATRTTSDELGESPVAELAMMDVSTLDSGLLEPMSTEEDDGRDSSVDSLLAGHETDMMGTSPGSDVKHEQTMRRMISRHVHPGSPLTLSTLISRHGHKRITRPQAFVQLLGTFHIVLSGRLYHGPRAYPA